MSETKTISAEDLKRLDALRERAIPGLNSDFNYMLALRNAYPGIRARIAKLEAQLQRAMDLVRFARHYLHGENLITNEELGDLVIDTDCGSRVTRLIDTKEVRAIVDKDGWIGPAVTHKLCDELDALRKPVGDCPMCHGAGVVERRVAYSDKVDACPACARFSALEAENRRLREWKERNA